MPTFWVKLSITIIEFSPFFFHFICFKPKDSQHFALHRLSSVRFKYIIICVVSAIRFEVLRYFKIDQLKDDLLTNFLSAQLEDLTALFYLFIPVHLRNPYSLKTFDVLLTVHHSMILGNCPT